MALKTALHWERIATSKISGLLSFTETKGLQPDKPGYKKLRNFPVLFMKWEVLPVSPHFGRDLEEEITAMVTLLTPCEYSRQEVPV